MKASPRLSLTLRNDGDDTDLEAMGDESATNKLRLNIDEGEEEPRDKGVNHTFAKLLKQQLIGQLKRKTVSDDSMNVQVTLLGTGSAAPSKHRNNSGIWLRLSKPQKPDASIILDIGEGICGQLFHSLGGIVKSFLDMLLTVKVIWISHHHADHICGFPMLLEHIYRARIADTSKVYRPVIVICPPDVINYYHFCATASGLDDLVTFKPIRETLYAGYTSIIENETYGMIKKLQSVPVSHCRDAYAVAITALTGLQIIYSGDCRPNENLINIGRNRCDLLIHEATFEDAMVEDAVKKQHCTIAEALRVAEAMKAKHVVLTHFSQRYPSHPSLDTTDDDSNRERKFIVAFDLLQFNFPSEVEDVELATHRIIASIEK